MSTTYGYVRVSSSDQNEDRQMLAMAELDIPLSHIFVDKMSGKDFERPAYKALLKSCVTEICYTSKVLTA